MKRALLFCVTLCVSFLFYSCRSYRVIDIETYNPAAITFPSETKTILVVNNSAQQPDHIGHHAHNNAKGESEIAVSVDSMAYFFCRSLGVAIAEASVFEDVRLCEDTLRRDSFFYNIVPFTLTEVKSLCQDYEVDALISLDKMYFNTMVFDFNFQNMYRQNYFRVDLTGELRVLWPEQKEVYTLPFSDSLIWLVEDDGIDLGKHVMKILSVSEMKDAMRHLSEYTAEKMQGNIVPFWSEEKRWYYVHITSVWKQGTAFAAAGKWTEAINKWQPLFDKEKNGKRKARLASNLALCNEMIGDFKKAIEYAEVAYELFKKYTHEEDAYTKMQSAYLKVLQQRKEADHLLSKQLHE